MVKNCSRKKKKKRKKEMSDFQPSQSTQQDFLENKSFVMIIVSP